MSDFNAGTIDSATASQRLGVSRTRLYELRTAFLRDKPGYGPKKPAVTIIAANGQLVRHGGGKRAGIRFMKQSARVCDFEKHGLTSGLIEGFNNLIASIIQKACEMRDLDYMELKSRHRSVMCS